MLYTINTLFADAGVAIYPCTQATGHSPPLVPVQQIGCQSGDVEESGTKHLKDHCIVRCDVFFNVILFVL